MEIRKRTNDYGRYDIEIENDFKLLSIYQGGDDPNIMCRYANFEDMKEGLFNITFDFEQIDGKSFHMPKSPYGIQISIRQSGCRYDPFNIPFNRMFRELQKIEETKDNNACKVLKKMIFFVRKSIGNECRK